MRLREAARRWGTVVGVTGHAHLGAPAIAYDGAPEATHLTRGKEVARLVVGKDDGEHLGGDVLRRHGQGTRVRSLALKPSSGEFDRNGTRRFRRRRNLPLNRNCQAVIGSNGHI